jgi:hypothetical protein
MSAGSTIAGLERAETWARGRASLVITSLLIACVALGAALGAGIHPASSLVRSESQLSVAAPTAGLQAIAWHTVGQALKLPALRSQIAQLGGVEASALRIGTSGDPRSALITVYAEADTGPQAELLANSAASVVVNFLRQTVQAAVVSRSPFEASTELWDIGYGIFALRPLRVNATHTVAHSGVGSLEVNCETPVPGGCGPYLRLERAFRVGRSYSAVGWVKATPGTRIRLVLGASSSDVAVGSVANGTGRWEQLSVTWTPQSSSNLAVTVFQVMSLGPSHFNIDDVAVGPQAAVQRGETTSASAAAYRTIAPATASSTLGSGHTAEWAAGGAAAGLLVAAAAAAAATAAARRRSRKRGAGQETLF